MDHKQDVSKGTESAARLELSLLPRQGSDPRARSQALTGATLGPRLSPFVLPEDVLNEVHIIYENIQALAAKQKMRVIGIASANPKEGSSLVAAALSMVSAKSYRISNDSRYRERRSQNAIELANDRRNRGVVLLDAQLRNPTIHQIFRLPAHSGLLDYLSTEISEDSVDFPQRANTEAEIKYVPNLHLNIITAGTASRTRASQIDSAKLTSLFQLLGRQFVQVFVDLPAILPCAEGRAIAKMCDGIVLVVRAGYSRYPAVEKARRLLENAGVSIVGGIVNRRRFYIPERIYRWL